MVDAQLEFGFRAPPRKRARKRGRPRNPGAGVAHARRIVHPRFPQHVTLRMARHVWQLRSRRCFRILEGAFYVVAGRVGARIAHFSVQRDHVHLIVEARDLKALATALQSFTIRVAKGLNRLMGCSGRVFADRYHSRPLRTPTEVRRALVYVLRNTLKHVDGGRSPGAWIDPFSSGAWFTGWAWKQAAPSGACPVSRPGTWLLSSGWCERAGGPIRADEVPTSPRRS